MSRLRTNRARFGILYADNLGTEYKPVNSSVFDTQIDYNSNDKSENFNNPFFAELVSGYETMDDMEKRWKSNFVKETGMRDAILDYETNVFTGEKDVSGIHNIDPFAFYDLNSGGEEKVSIFGPGNETNLDFMQDIDDISW